MSRSIKYERDAMDEIERFGPRQRRQPASKFNMVFSFPHRLKNEKDPKVWEDYVAQLLPSLGDVERICRKIVQSTKLQQEVKDAASHWLKLIADTRVRADRSNKTIIGVFGDTGSGKSTVIKAVLGEGKLLPAQTWRACTACVVEVSYNHDKDLDHPYRAEIEFISQEEWIREVGMALEGLESCDDEAAKSLAKLQAVYPGMKHEALAQASPAQLAQREAVSNVLGSTLKIPAASGKELHDRIKLYIDSKDKGQEDEMAHWPLVKAVRIFTKAEALSNGVTIVDLPGLQDCNAARAAVATGYMKSCSGIWIVAPIDRAVDNKTAKNLMSDAFKRQLRLDGSFSTVTFICSKTDQMNLNDAMVNFEKVLKPPAMKRLDEWKECGRQVSTLNLEINKLRNKLLRSPQTKNDSDEEPPAKRLKFAGFPMEETSGTGDQPKPAEDQPLESSDDSISDQIARKTQELESMKARKQTLRDEVLCDSIQARNDISRESMRQYFSCTLREADWQTPGGNGQGDNSSSDQARYYADLSKRLPVFCTSSSVYQAYQGLLEDDAAPTAGFAGDQDTEIPQLQEHAKKLSEELRIAKHREVLGDTCQVLNSIAIWTQNVSATSTSFDATTLDSLLTEVEKGLLEEREEFLENIQDATENKLYDKMNNVRDLAISQAKPIASRWTSSQKYGGLHFMTLRCIFRGNGLWKDHDFNQELLEPFASDIAGYWQNFFEVEFPMIMDLFAASAVQKLASFHQDITRELKNRGFDDLQTLEQLKQQMKLHKRQLLQLGVASRAAINSAQREANRAPVASIIAWMIPAYQECLTISGNGTVRLMGYAISHHLRNEQRRMFSSAAKSAKTILELELRRIEERLLAKINSINATMRNDYMMAPAAREKSAGRREAKLQASMAEVLEETHRLFK